MHVNPSPPHRTDDTSATADQPLRILAVANWDFAGAPTPWAIQRVEALRRAGAEVEVLSEDCVADRGGFVRLHRALTRRLRDGRFDVVAPLYGSMLGLVCSLQRRAPVAVHFVGTDLNGGSRPGRVGLHSLSQPMSQLTAALAGGVAVVNGQMRDALWWPWARRRAQVIEDGTDTRRFRPVPRAEARRLRGLPIEGARVAMVALNSVGAPRPYKRTGLVREAVARLPSVTLEIVEKVPFAEMPLVYASSDVLVLSSLKEGSPNCVREALACGLPVVSTDVGDVRDVVGGLTNCHLVAPDPAAIAGAISAVIADGRGCPEGPARVAARYSLEATTRRFMDFYRAAGRAGA